MTDAYPDVLRERAEADMLAIQPPAVDDIDWNSPEDAIYDRLAAVFSVPLPPPEDVPPAVPLPCSHAQLRQPHTPHPWQPQPGMRPVQCAGWEHVPADG